MSRKIGVYVSVLLVLLLQLTASTMVLPRPPSSLNHIRHDQRELSSRKAVEGKSLHGVSRNIDAGRPDTEDYRLLEIELQSAEEMDATNLQGLVRAMLKQQQSEQTPNDSYPNPEVIPHSILGVRDMGLSPNYRLDTFDDDKRVLLSPPKLQSLDEKLYYLKSGRPKVYVNVRGNSGSFRKGETASPTATSSEGPVGYLRVTRPFERQTDRKIRDKKARPPKKFDRRVDGIVLGDEQVGKISDQGASYGADDLSTTENSMVTSSELPKQIPAPPSKVRGRVLMVQTTPVQRYALRRTDILPGYGFTDE
ncbi:PREDICTED: uncharacterized protein LOC106751967 isoform X2 [Dinoponera quadriceps]|nr:PREDICTED: uncharacterized protein LOC106751967 isoform X2 [Dinoponera quadriceps]XP_014488782.1 PREDICTED: uncharacterized protein LOC106751967 isoform X2 [Dinoponera quadriceps]